MKPGEIIPLPGDIQLNDRHVKVRCFEITNPSDAPIMIGSHYHLVEANSGLEFDRVAARGYRLDIDAGSAMRFEPGDTYDEIELISLPGHRS